MSDPSLIPEPDPADVAAGGPAASALLGTAPAPGQAPAGPIPVVPATPLVDPSSRYAGVEIATWVGVDGVERPYLRRRVAPQPEQLATAGWDVVGPGDRIDLVAARTLGDGRLFWQLCDANGAFDPAELEQPGRRLRVALPEGFPGPEEADHG
jgi:hypothetical protein